jgi:hypothetical protein
MKFVELIFGVDVFGGGRWDQRVRGVFTIQIQHKEQRMRKFHCLSLHLIAFAFVQAAQADTVQYTTSPALYPSVTTGLVQEFGTASFPPLTETALSYYQVQGSGPVTLTFRFHFDTGGFLFNFGYYRWSPALDAIDTSTTAGKIAYATQALAPGNASLIFDDATDEPGAVRTVTLNGGDVIGFFLIPDESLATFQSNPASFAVDGTGSIRLGLPGANRWPLFGLAAANPDGADQLMSFSGTSAATGNPSSMFAWEDLTRATIAGNPYPSDNAFNDLIFGIEGVSAVQPPQITCSDITVGNDPGECAATVSAYNVTVNGSPAPVVTCTPPPGTTFQVGTTTVTCTASNSAGISTCTFTVTVLDVEAPTVTVQAAQNPAGGTVPAAGQNPKSGQNPDGFYVVGAQDNCDEDVEIYVSDSGSSLIAGPFASGDIVKISRGVPGVRTFGDTVVAHISVLGDALVYAVDDAGNVSEAEPALVPPGPK